MANTSIDEAIRQAQSQNTNAAPASKELEVVNTGSSNGVANYAPAKAPSLDDLGAGAMNVDGYLKVKEFGLLIDAKPNLLDSVNVTIDMNEMQAFTGLRYGDPVTYVKTYDGVTAASGGTWNEALERARRVKPDVRPYMGADIQMTLTEDAKDAKGAIVATAGTRLGHSTSVTNRAEVAAFIKAVKDKGYAGQTVQAKLGFKPMSNPKGQKWGIVTFELIGLDGAE